MTFHSAHGETCTGDTGRRRSGPLLLGGLATAIASIAPAAAQDAARMEAIERQIRALQQELQLMRREAARRDAEARAARQEAERARTEAQAMQRRLDSAPPTMLANPPGTAAATPPSPSGDVRLSFPSGRPTIGTADGRIQASLGALFQYDVGGFIQGPAPTPQTLPLSSFGENLRRGRLYFGFQYDNLRLNLTPDFGGSPDGSPTLFEANLNWTPLRPLTLTLGYFKPWYSLVNSMSASDLLFLERPSIVNMARSIAAGIQRASVGGRWAKERWFLAGYLTGDTFGSNSATQVTSGQTGGVARFAGRPVAGDDWDLHLGFSGSYTFDVRRNTSGQTLRLQDWPELRIGSSQSQLIDTGSLPADKAWTWGPEFGLRWRNFLLQGEFIQIGVDQAAAGAAPRPDLIFQGGYVELGWVITGEPRTYNSASAAFSRPNPQHPFSLREGGWGAWELSARYSLADLNDKVTRGRPQSATGGVFGGRQEVIGIALSWYPMPQLRFILQWDIVDVNRLNAAGTTQIGQRFHSIALRSQLAF